MHFICLIHTRAHARTLRSNSIRRIVWDKSSPVEARLHVQRVMHVGLPCYTISLIASCSKHSHLTLLCRIPTWSRVTADLLDFLKTRVQSSLQSHGVTSDFITRDIQGYAVWLSPDNTDKSPLSLCSPNTLLKDTQTPTIRGLEGSHVLTYSHTHAQWKPSL